MNTYNFVHLALAAMGGRIQGRTKLQKTIYFLGVITGNLGELGYRPHFYGPYSAEVADAIDRLKSLGFVDQNVASGGGYDGSGFEVARYDYKLTEQGATVAAQKKQAHANDWERIQGAAARLKAAKKEDYVKLSIAAKTHFMLGERNEPATISELADLAKSFGWSVTPEQVKEAADYLASLKLVNLQSTGG